jgi:peptidoglycan hydrolase-like amidase
MTFTLSGSSVKLSGSRLAFPSGFSICCAEDSGRLQLNGRSYRGTIRVVVWNNKLACINALPIEEYLWGVVPCEVPDTWPQEVLRAQAVASRTYSFRALEQYPNRPFDVYSTTADQVYHGCSDEADSTTAACEDTLGQICMWDGKPIIAYYSSVAGGWTASSSEAFGQDYPYLRATLPFTAGPIASQHPTLPPPCEAPDTA